jgi:thiol-disulfide isomerase/thioredoxin
VRPTTQRFAPPTVERMTFSAVTIDGHGVTVPDDYPGKLILVSVWATWCPSSNRELPFWKEAYAKYHDRGVEFVGLATDKNRKRSAEVVSKFLKDNGIVWPQIYEEAPEIALTYKADTLPTSFLVDGDSGKVLFQGGSIRKANLAKQLDTLLEQRAKATTQPSTSPSAP